MTRSACDGANMNRKEKMNYPLMWGGQGGSRNIPDIYLPMYRKILIQFISFLLLAGVHSAFSQQFYFSPNGKMVNGLAVPDTIFRIPEKIRFPGRPYVFGKLEEKNGYLKIGDDSIFVSKDYTLRDSVEAFFLLNSGSAVMKLKTQGGSLIAIKEALTFDNRWKPVEYWSYDWCGNSFTELQLMPQQMVIFYTRKQYGMVANKLRVRLRTESIGVILSIPFEGRFDEDYFILNSTHQKFERVLKEKLNFLK